MEAPKEVDEGLRDPEGRCHSKEVGAGIRHISLVAFAACDSLPGTRAAGILAGDLGEILGEMLGGALGTRCIFDGLVETLVLGIFGISDILAVLRILGKLGEILGVFGNPDKSAVLRIPVRIPVHIACIPGIPDGLGNVSVAARSPPSREAQGQEPGVGPAGAAEGGAGRQVGGQAAARIGLVPAGAGVGQAWPMSGLLGLKNPSWSRLGLEGAAAAAAAAVVVASVVLCRMFR